MKNSANSSKVKVYLAKHWFKLAFLSLLLYLFIQKDFNFSIHLNSPEDEQSKEVNPDYYLPQASPKKQTLTEKKKESSKFLDKFEMPSFFGGTDKYNPVANLAKIEEKTKHDYLKRFARVVINERRKFGIPSSIILACGLLQSQAGQRDMAKQGNNHFALTCSLNWEGETGSYQGDCYRHYENAWTSFRDHSTYLTSPKFATLTTLESTDYKAWAKGLAHLKYGNIADLEQDLVRIIEKYGLEELDSR